MRYICFPKIIYMTAYNVWLSLTNRLYTGIYIVSMSY